MLVYPHINPIALQVGPLAIHWYGLMYMAGFLCFIWLGRKRIITLSHPQLTNKLLDDLLFYGVLGVILGGRLGEVLFYNPAYYFANPLKILAVWEGGMSFHGGFLGVLVAMAIPIAHAGFHEQQPEAQGKKHKLWKWGGGGGKLREHRFRAGSFHFRIFPREPLR